MKEKNFLIVFGLAMLLLSFTATAQDIILLHSDVDLTHACTYYKINTKAITKNEDVFEFFVSRIKEVHGKLKTLTIDVLVENEYYIQTPIYQTVRKNIEIDNLTKEYMKKYEEAGLDYLPHGCEAKNETHFLNCSFNEIVDYENKKELKEEYITFYEIRENEMNKKRKDKDLYFFLEKKEEKINTEKLEKMKIKENYVLVRVCGVYEFEKFENKALVSIDHIPIFKGIEYTQYAWWNATWQYRRAITINNTQNSNNLTDYQVLVTLDTQSPISQGKMRSDCGDIRFTDSDETTQLNYWLESGCNTTSTKIWVKVPSIPANSTKTIYVYYGNPDAAYNNTAGGENTFIFFDDFSTNKLSSYMYYRFFGDGQRNFSVQNGYLYDIEGNPNRDEAVSFTVNNIQLSNFAVTATLVNVEGVNSTYWKTFAVAAFKNQSSGYNHVEAGYWKQQFSTTKFAFAAVGSSGDLANPCANGLWCFVNVSHDGKGKKITLAKYLNDFYVFVNDFLENKTTNTYLGSYSFFVGFKSGTCWNSENANATWDNFYVRNFVYPEPTTSVGEEETPTTTTSTTTTTTSTSTTTTSTITTTSTTTSTTSTSSSTTSTTTTTTSSTTTTIPSVFNDSVNDFVYLFTTNLSMFFGGNMFALIGVLLVFVFGTIYALGVPRIITIPLAVFALIFASAIIPDIKPFVVIIAGIGLAFLLFKVFER